MTHEGVPPSLRTGHPHVWVVDVTNGAFAALADTDLCSEQDEKRAAALRDGRAQRLLRARRVALRIVLSRYLGCDPGDVRLVIAPGGKPVLIPRARTEGLGCPVSFSIGHSGDLYCIAVGAEGSLGCDVEVVRPVPRALAIATRWFGRSEAARLEGLSGREMEMAFMDLWTAKEALAKRHGAGLRLMHGQAEAPEVHDALDVDRERIGGFLRDFVPGDRYVGALASSSFIDTVEVIRPGSPTWII